MTSTEKANKSIQEAIRLLREKSPRSTLVERHFLLYEAWDRVKGLPQPLQLGEGLCYVLEQASLPVAQHDLLLGRFDDHVPTEAEEARLQTLWQTDPNTNPILCKNGGHMMLDFETVVLEGLSGRIRKTEERLALARSGGEEENTCLFLQGMLRCYEGIRRYIARYAEAAQKEGLEDCAQVCRSLTNGAPQTFREALQLTLFVYIIYLVYAGKEIACLTVGRLDDFLLPFYLRDLRQGILTEAEAGALIDDFSAKMSLHLGRGEHQMAYLNEDYVQTGWLRNPVYDAPGYIILGGYSGRTDHTRNPLTILFAKHIHPELKNPIYVCRHTADSPEELWDILAEKLRQNASLLLYNDETVIPAYLHAGVERQDAINYGIFPCNWASLSGCCKQVHGHAGRPLPVVLNDVLHSGVDFDNMDQIYDSAKAHYARMIRPNIEYLRENYANGAIPPNGILSLNDCFMRDTLERGRGSGYGGVKYPVMYVVLRNIGTAADMLSAVDSLVFRNRVCTLRELVEAADRDFEGCEELLQRCQKAPKYGNDDDFADGHARRLMSELLDVVDEEAVNARGERDVYLFCVTINDSLHLQEGAALPATVNGRRKGKPLSENLSPSVGCAGAATSVLKSVAKLPFDRIHSGALNLRVSRRTFQGENGLVCLKALIHAYFAQGGMQLQLSFADTAELLAAQRDPDAYRDLLVRITGYSAIFVDMAKDAQNEFIRRDAVSSC